MEIRPLGPGFGAEVRGADLAEVAADDDAYAMVRAAFEAHSVLLFRGQPVSDDLQVAFSRRFGPLETAKAGRPWPDDQPRHMVRTTVSATDADGLGEMWPKIGAAQSS
ncbi:MAG: TauD/TfdA dioxygenase family protein [Betaproteobacteria bacterium]